MCCFKWQEILPTETNPHYQGEKHGRFHRSFSRLNLIRCWLTIPLCDSLSQSAKTRETFAMDTKYRKHVVYWTVPAARWSSWRNVAVLVLELLSFTCLSSSNPTSSRGKCFTWRCGSIIQRHERDRCSLRLKSRDADWDKFRATCKCFPPALFLICFGLVE